MATNCTSEDVGAPRHPRRPADEALAWAATAFRSERLLRALHDRRPADDAADRGDSF